MEFKKLEIKPEGNWFKRTIKSTHLKKTVIVSLICALIGYIIFYFGQGAGTQEFWNDDALQNTAIGLAIGIYLTNSPCARGRC